MGAHRARQCSSAGKIAGRGALTAAAALALTGGTATAAFAAEAPNLDNTTSTVESTVTHAAEGAQSLPDTEVPSSASDVEHLVGDEANGAQDAGEDIASAATSDLQTAANANGIPVGSHATDTEQEVAGQVRHVTGPLHDKAGATAHQIDDAAAQGQSMLSFA